MRAKDSVAALLGIGAIGSRPCARYAWWSLSRSRSLAAGSAAARTTRTVDAASGDGRQLRRARARSHLGRCPARRLHAQERNEVRARPRHGQRRRQGGLDLRRTRRLVVHVPPGSRAHARRLAARLHRRDPLDEPWRDEQRDEHRDRSGVGCTVDAPDRQGRAGDIRLRDLVRRCRTREERDSDLELGGHSRSRVPLRSRPEHTRRQDPAERLLPLPPGHRRRHGERPGLDRLHLERERKPRGLRERHRAERR